MAKKRKSSGWSKFRQLNKHHGLDLRSLKDAWDNGERGEMTAETAIYYGESDPLSFSALMHGIDKDAFYKKYKSGKKNPSTETIGTLIIVGLIGYAIGNNP